MATPRKYPTLAEFDALRATVENIEKKLNEKPKRPSVLIDAYEASRALGLMDAYGVPVSLGDSVREIDGTSVVRIVAITVCSARETGSATLTVRLDDGANTPAVDRKLLRYVVDELSGTIKKTTA